MYQFFLILFVIVSVVLIILIMLQQNSGDSIGGAFNYRSLTDMLNSGSFNDNITRLIIVLAILFFLLSLLLGNMNSKHNNCIDIENQKKINSVNMADNI